METWNSAVLKKRFPGYLMAYYLKKAIDSWPSQVYSKVQRWFNIRKFIIIIHHLIEQRK